MQIHLKVVPSNPWDVQQVAKATAGTALQKEIDLHCLICRSGFTASVKSFWSQSQVFVLSTECYSIKTK